MRQLCAHGVVLCFALGLNGLASEKANAQTLATGAATSMGERAYFLDTTPTQPDRLYVATRSGKVRIVENGMLLATPFLDLADVPAGQLSPVESGCGECGLLGIAFAEDYATSGKFYVSYTTSGSLRLRIEEYRRDTNNPLAIDKSTARTIIEIPQFQNNHNGGWIDFGPDGYLYLASGDGGGGNDPADNGQDTGTLQGTILRLDVSNDAVPYTIPPSNPFVGLGPSFLEEIWAYGLRNPWRNSFDRVTGDLWIADVGQNNREEVNRQLASSPGGENYGWRCREGDIQNPAFTCSVPGATDPVIAYPHTNGNCSITGGYVYRGCALGREFSGTYIYGDFCTGLVWSYDPNTGTNTQVADLANFSLYSFGEDTTGELYAMLGNDVVELVNPARPADAQDIVDYLAELDAMLPVADRVAPLGTPDFFDLLDITCWANDPCTCAY